MMEGMMAAGGGVFFLIVIAFLFVLAVLWFLFPFAVFGTKDILKDILFTQRQILKELQRTNGAEEESQKGLRAEKKDSGH